MQKKSKKRLIASLLASTIALQAGLPASAEENTINVYVDGIFREDKTLSDNNFTTSTDISLFKRNDDGTVTIFQTVWMGGYDPRNG